MTTAHYYTPRPRKPWDSPAGARAPSRLTPAASDSWSSSTAVPCADPRAQTEGYFLFQPGRIRVDWCHGARRRNWHQVLLAKRPAPRLASSYLPQRQARTPPALHPLQRGVFNVLGLVAAFSNCGYLPTVDACGLRLSETRPR